MKKKIFKSTLIVLYSLFFSSCQDPNWMNRVKLSNGVNGSFVNKIEKIDERPYLAQERIFNVENGYYHSVIKKSENDATFISLSPDGNTLAFTDHGKIKLYNVKIGKIFDIPNDSEIRDITVTRVIGFSGNSKYLRFRGHPRGKVYESRRWPSLEVDIVNGGVRFMDILKVFCSKLPNYCGSERENMIVGDFFLRTSPYLRDDYVVASFNKEDRMSDFFSYSITSNELHRIPSLDKLDYNYIRKNLPLNGDLFVKPCPDPSAIYSSTVYCVRKSGPNNCMDNIDFLVNKDLKGISYAPVRGFENYFVPDQTFRKGEYVIHVGGASDINCFNRNPQWRFQVYKLGKNIDLVFEAKFPNKILAIDLLDEGKLLILRTTQTLEMVDLTLKVEKTIHLPFKSFGYPATIQSSDDGSVIAAKSLGGEIHVIELRRM